LSAAHDLKQKLVNLPPVGSMKLSSITELGVHKLAAEHMACGWLCRWAELFAVELTRSPLTKLAPFALPALTQQSQSGRHLPACWRQAKHAGTAR
jgi:hypothetical protein